METFTRAVPGAANIEADMCRRCTGVWYDASEVAAAHGALAELQWQPAGAFEYPRNPAQCPRCNRAMQHVRFFHATLDHCPGCHGVWVDGDEHVALANAPRDAALQSSPYRDASAALYRGVVKCARCAKEVPLAVTLMTGAGVMCEACAAEHESAPVDSRDPEVEALRQEAGADAAGLVRREWGAWSFVKDVGAAVGKALAALPTHCAICGRLRGTCSH